jgi:hypothetical protein
MNCDLRLSCTEYVRCCTRYLIVDNNQFIAIEIIVIGKAPNVSDVKIDSCRRFDPTGSLDRRVNCRRVSQPRWVGARRSTKGGKRRQAKGGNPRPSCCLAPRSGALALGGYKRPRGREREPCTSARSPARPTFPYECPRPSFYRRKERAQVYNGGCSSVLTCLAERS